MTSLAEAYEGQMGEYASLRRLYLGVGLFLFGTLLVLVGIGVAATEAGTEALGLTRAREVGIALGGLGVPAVFLGIFSVLPADRRTRAAAVVGAGVGVLGVALFVHAYPCHISGSNCGEPYLTLPTIGVYFLGVITTFWCLFVGVANFKSRNDPGGTVKLEVTREGETRVVEVPESSLGGAKGGLGGIGGVGFLGGTPDGDIETQTNDESGGWPDADRTRGDATASDGGATADDVRPLRDEGTGAGSPSREAPGPAGPGDRRNDRAAGDAGGDRPANAGDAYCGSCAHFQYVRTDDGMQPYCGLHDEVMEDMDACDEWTPR
ncbi:DUF7139 domain-containing protein [Candidatus Halobonum tyrrellensis]|uniref:Uncharacterized protein n=1 Tax=Candidatus Halobonum tyrrellensis G22 TaxID=1324957 RepID=V4HPR2_9EURY|nr:hypothetical protein [Candidatus Halobonum tyrrellensis]ESP89889.1 hypothetical protein K933_01667 [Candidatus Halobonum tyrrellensis G22]